MKDLLWGLIFIFFALYIYLTDVPFFIGTDFARHKVTEWLYGIVGQNILSLFFLCVGSVLIWLWARKQWQDKD